MIKALNGDALGGIGTGKGLDEGEGGFEAVVRPPGGVENLFVRCVQELRAGNGCTPASNDIGSRLGGCNGLPGFFPRFWVFNGFVVSLEIKLGEGDVIVFEQDAGGLRKADDFPLGGFTGRFAFCEIVYLGTSRDFYLEYLAVNVNYLKPAFS